MSCPVLPLPLAGGDPGEVNNASDFSEVTTPRTTRAQGIQRLRTVFSFMDDDNDGVVTVEDLRRTVPMLLGIDPCEESAHADTVETILNALDSDGDGKVTFEDFTEGLRQFLVDDADDGDPHESQSTTDDDIHSSSDLIDEPSTPSPPSTPSHREQQLQPNGTPRTPSSGSARKRRSRFKSSKAKNNSFLMDLAEDNFYEGDSQMSLGAAIDAGEPVLSSPTDCGAEVVTTNSDDLFLSPPRAASSPSSAHVTPDLRTLRGYRDPGEKKERSFLRTQSGSFITRGQIRLALQNQFKAFAEKDGAVSVPEIAAFLNAQQQTEDATILEMSSHQYPFLPSTPSNETANLILKHVDKNKDGMVSLDEFVEATYQHLVRQMNENGGESTCEGAGPISDSPLSKSPPSVVFTSTILEDDDNYTISDYSPDSSLDESLSVHSNGHRSMSTGAIRSINGSLGFRSNLSPKQLFHAQAAQNESTDNLLALSHLRREIDMGKRMDNASRVNVDLTDENKRLQRLTEEGEEWKQKYNFLSDEHESLKEDGAINEKKLDEQTKLMQKERMECKRLSNVNQDIGSRLERVDAECEQLRADVKRLKAIDSEYQKLSNEHAKINAEVLRLNEFAKKAEDGDWENQAAFLKKQVLELMKQREQDKVLLEHARSECKTLTLQMEDMKITVHEDESPSIPDEIHLASPVSLHPRRSEPILRRTTPVADMVQRPRCNSILEEFTSVEPPTSPMLRHRYSDADMHEYTLACNRERNELNAIQADVNGLMEQKRSLGKETDGIQTDVEELLEKKKILTEVAETLASDNICLAKKINEREGMKQRNLSALAFSEEAEMSAKHIASLQMQLDAATGQLATSLAEQESLELGMDGMAFEIETLRARYREELIRVSELTAKVKNYMLKEETATPVVVVDTFVDGDERRDGNAKSNDAVAVTVAAVEASDGNGWPYTVLVVLWVMFLVYWKVGREMEFPQPPPS